ncbi:MCP four helix bundle domain-containing protein [Pontibacter oryzae]|uniref:Chemotaxis methyl-accepting receptor HlyB-like 4HB MCP domain-containing protein n=1 Tax=Pontibacter oryzae TaxID=2304593 RepID=A0A399SI24_9BACT|nr:MCP four helix bundle domain-containing protein [Pontibacter oryzae]RIJ41752.1 hypothetical protein D1627_06955 [Pontibacter oryzae]
MSWTFRIKQRDRIALALAAVFLIIVMANWFVNYSMTQVSQQFRSVYADRLVPALDISAMQERYYQNRFLLEKHLQSDNPAEQQELAHEMTALNAELDSLIRKFEATYLTEQEAADFKRFLTANAAYSNMQATIVGLSSNQDRANAEDRYKVDGMAAFQLIIERLHALSSIQEKVGLELYSDAERQMKSLKVLSYLVIALAVILALLVGTLLQTSRKLNRLKQQQFHWN